MKTTTKDRKLLKRAALVLAAAAMLLSFGCQADKAGSTGVAFVNPTATPAAAASPSPTPASTPTPAPTPTIAPTPTPVTALSAGMESPEVTKLQQRLIDLGYLKAGLASGYYGDKTKQAVTLFQKQNKLKADGVAGSEVLSLIYTDNAKKYSKPDDTQESGKPLAGYVIGLDPGHQRKASSEQEPVAPGSSETKKEVSSGTQGKWSRVPEYQVNLDVALMLRDLLKEQGATVVMTRETNDVNISNAERAKFFNKNKTDLALRLHCNGSNDPSVHGAFMLIPKENPYLSGCKTAAKLILAGYCKETGAKNLGVTPRGDQTGFNWCERLIVNIEMGHMTNKEEDAQLTDSAYQKKMARGLLDGILDYFETKNG